MMEIAAGLSVAIVAGALVMLSLAFMTRQTLVQRHKTVITAHAGRAAAAIADEIRRGTRVMEFRGNSITFVGGLGDTIAYLFRNDSLLKNGRPAGLFSEGTRPVAFSVEIEDTSNGPQDALFSISLETRDKSGATVQSHGRVRTAYVPEETAR